MTKKEQAVFDKVQNKLNQAVVAKMLAGETVDEKLKGAAEIINALSEELEAARRSIIKIKSRKALFLL